MPAQEKTSGYFSVNITGETSEFNLKALNARAQFGELLVKQEKYELTQAVPTSLSVRNGQIRVEQFQWKGPGLYVGSSRHSGLGKRPSPGSATFR